ncbi:hypothetical protein [Labilibacter marinus]|uniref:hypothetical protein n=1 Tax=Labilibacter marinus TaxID=1477105 RepID=UPI00095001AF|nr:hypothetical protein [Labilibacter marinus]
MTKIIGLLLVLTFLSSCAQGKQSNFPGNIKTTKTDKHERVKGTKVFVKIPEEYKYIKELGRYQKNEKLYIQVIESNASSFYDAKPNLSKEVMESKGAKVDIFKEIELNEFGCIYTEGPSKYAGETKLGLFFGDGNFVVMIAGVCKDSDINGKKELRDIFETIYYEKALALNPLELADFEFDKSITGFKYAMTASNMFMFAENGKSDAQNPTSNSMNIGIMPQMTEEKAKTFAKDLPWRYERSGIQLNNKEMLETKIGDYTAFVLETKIKFQNKNGIMYQAIIIGNQKCILFLGSAYKDLNNYLDKYKRTVETIEMK